MNFNFEKYLRSSLLLVLLGPGSSMAQSLVPVSLSPSAEIQLAPLQAEALSGREGKLPEEAEGRLLILIFGFTHASKKSSSLWENHLWNDFDSNSRCAIYGIADLSGAPRILHGMIKSAMRSGLSPLHQDHFLILEKNGDDWKKRTGWLKEAADDSYLVLVSNRGEMLWQIHSPYSDADYQQLKNKINETLMQSP